MSTPPINTASSGLPATTPASSSSNSSSQGASSTGDLANQNVFLQLLVAQLKYQDPSNPADGTAFITQLAQFSELSNSTQMVSQLGNIQQLLATSAVTSGSSSAATSAASGSAPPNPAQVSSGSNTAGN